jgi:hypothetical protein
VVAVGRQGGSQYAIAVRFPDAFSFLTPTVYPHELTLTAA